MREHLPFDDFIEIIKETESYMTHPVVRWQLERLKQHYPDKIVLLDERIRIVDKLQTDGIDAVIKDLNLIRQLLNLLNVKLIKMATTHKLMSIDIYMNSCQKISICRMCV